MKIVTCAQMRQLEERAVAAGVSLDTLMESAGLAVARRIVRLLDGVRGKRVVVLVGPGNNGGDGMVAARYLADWGALITLYMTSNRRREDKFEECRSRQVRVVEAADDPEQMQLASYVPLADLVVDAVLGIGAGDARPLDGSIGAALTAVGDVQRRQPALRVVAIDVPTGLNADSGACDDACIEAAITLTLGAPKIGLFRFPGARVAGRIEAIGIGLPDGIDGGLAVDLADDASVSAVLPARRIDAHKGSHGSLLVVAGSRSFVGAPVLTAAAAYRAGAGLVTLAAPETVYRIAATGLLEQVHLPLPETERGNLGPTAVGATRTALEAATAAVVGPGLGSEESVRLFLESLLLSDPNSRGAAPETPIVLDADALNALAATYGWWKRVRAPAVLTPHPGEMARLTGRAISDVQDFRIETASEAASTWGQVVVLKGALTVIASPDGRVTISPFSNPALSTAGTGDVLAGIIGALMAQGAGPYDAAVAGVYVHAKAAETLRGRLGDGGMLASDLLLEVPPSMQALRST